MLSLSASETLTAPDDVQRHVVWCQALLNANTLTLSGDVLLLVSGTGAIVIIAVHWEVPLTSAARVSSPSPTAPALSDLTVTTSITTVRLTKAGPGTLAETGATAFPSAAPVRAPEG